MHTSGDQPKPPIVYSPLHMDMTSPNSKKIPLREHRQYACAAKRLNVFWPWKVAYFLYCSSLNPTVNLSGSVMNFGLANGEKLFNLRGFIPMLCATWCVKFLGWLHINYVKVERCRVWSELQRGQSSAMLFLIPLQQLKPFLPLQYLGISFNCFPQDLNLYTLKSVQLRWGGFSYFKVNKAFKKQIYYK